jgi:hypothetical protein
MIPHELYCDRRIGGTERWVYGDPREGLMRVPDMILASAVFLCVKENGAVKPAGTGCVLTIESDAATDNRHTYLVTARHCVEKAKHYGKLYVRLNAFGGGDAALIELPWAWEYHEDATNDVAVIRFPGPPIYEMMVFERESLATADLLAEKSIGVGEELVVVGLFTSHHGRTVNRPIVRSGIIAAMPDEPIQDAQSGLDFDAYLAEIRSIGGLSGSPVWVVIDPARPMPARGGFRSPTWSFYLLGLIRGHWEKEEEWLTDFGGTEQESLNTGIAMVTPIQKALDIIDSEALVKERKRVDRERAEKHGQVLDSAELEPEESEFERFEDLTRKLAQVPKSEIDEKRKES